MGKCAFLAILLAFAWTSGGHQVTINKCCREYEMLSGDGRACVQAPWPHNAALQFRGSKKRIVVRPLDGSWVRRWLPPGVPLERISNVTLGEPHYVSHWSYVVAANSSAIWDGQPLVFDDIWRRRVVVVGGKVIARPKPRGGFRKAHYCVDAARPPLAPFAVVFDTRVWGNNHVQKCCGFAHSLERENGTWKCTPTAGRTWTSNTSEFMRIVDPEMPYLKHNYHKKGDMSLYLPCANGRIGALPLAPGDKRVGNLIQSISHDFFFSKLTTCIDYETLANGSQTETIVYCEYSGITRGVYWLLRPLSFASSLLLAAALLSIATNDRIRRTPHGWSLACHAACLLAFNVGQIVFSFTVVDRVLTLTDDKYPIWA